jgi:hypothetical protein
VFLLYTLLLLHLVLALQAGEEWAVVPSESAAREAAEKSLNMFREQRIAEMTGGGSMVSFQGYNMSRP